MTAKRYLILGAGAAGLSLCHALLDGGVKDEIVLLDSKSSFTDDRTWCFWSSDIHPYSHLTSHCWNRWDVFSGAEEIASQSSPAVSYACLRGADFYSYVLEIIRRHPQVSVRLNCPVDLCESRPDGVSVTSGTGTWNADYVFDSRPRPVPSGGLTFGQRFFGQFLRAERPVFDPGRCTLMDFRVSQSRGLHFVYVLPFSPTEALVENTYIQTADAPKIGEEEHQAELADYLSKRYSLRDCSVQREEAGAIPMTTQPFPKRNGRIFFIGTAGGCSRPSSGYTFTRIQTQCRQIAEAVSAGVLEQFQEQASPKRYRFADTVLLQALQDHPEAFPEYFYRLFSRVPPSALTAFLSETSTWPSDLQILRSLPLGPFLKAALESAPQWTRSLTSERRQQIFRPG